MWGHLPSNGWPPTVYFLSERGTCPTKVFPLPKPDIQSQKRLGHSLKTSHREITATCTRSRPSSSPVRPSHSARSSTDSHSPCPSKRKSSLSCSDEKKRAPSSQATRTPSPARSFISTASDRGHSSRAHPSTGMKKCSKDPNRADLQPSALSLSSGD